VKLHSKF